MTGVIPGIYYGNLSCEWALKATEQAQELAIKDSKDKPGQNITVRIHCQITGCPMFFAATARNGNLTEGGRSGGFPCSTTEGFPLP